MKRAVFPSCFILYDQDIEVTTLTISAISRFAFNEVKYVTISKNPRLDAENNAVRPSYKTNPRVNTNSTIDQVYYRILLIYSLRMCS